MTDQPYQKTIETFWKGRAHDFASGSYVEMLKSVMLTEDPLVAVHRHLSEERFIRSLGVRHTDRILDLGCGFGRLTFFFAGLASEVDGVDLCEDYIAMGAKTQQQNKVENIKFQVADIEDFIPDANRYNLIFMGGLLPNIRDDEKILELIERLGPSLCKGGRFVVREPAPVRKIRIVRKVNIFRTIDEITGIFNMAGYRLQRLEEATPVGPIGYKMISTLFPSICNRRMINLAMTERLFRFQNRFNFVLKPLLQMKEMVLGYKSDIKIYFHVYIT